jgi:hypothetical protein
MLNRRSMLMAGLLTLLGPVAVFYAFGQAPAQSGPAYQIVLRSRIAEVAPMRSKDAQTGGGSIVVGEPELNTVVVTMGGGAVVGSEFCGSSAAMDFHLEQDLDIVPARQGVRPPRIGLVGRVVGTLQVSDPGKCCLKACGSAEQGLASATLSSGDLHLLSVNVQPTAAACGQELSINHRDGPVESTAAPGCYRLSGSFHFGVNQGKGVFCRQFAVADFDPAPQFDAFWANALKPFRAVPRRDFGFKVVLRVVEETVP